MFEYNGTLAHIFYHQNVYCLTKVKNEINSLAKMESHPGALFNERSQFFPVKFYSKVFHEKFESYKDVLQYVVNHQFNASMYLRTIEMDLADEYNERYVKAGIYYTIRNCIAFYVYEYEDLRDSAALDKAASDVLSLNGKSDLIAYINKYFCSDANINNYRYMQDNYSIGSSDGGVVNSRAFL
jgi:hypothetical protein